MSRGNASELGGQTAVTLTGRITMTDIPPLDRWRLDGLLAGPEKIWGLNGIAIVLGVSVDTARRLSQSQKAPIYRPGGRYFAFRSELVAWLRSK